MSYDRVELWSTASERSEFEDMAELYAILRTTESLEVANARDALEHTEYVEACSKLITQFKNTEKALIQRGSIESLQAFIRKFQIDCPRAVERMATGAPDGAFGSGQKQDDKKGAMALVREMTELFIYCSNLLSLNRTAVDELLPQLEALIRSLNKAKGLIQGFDPAPLEKWVRTMQGMRASEQLDEDEARQLMFDLNNAKAAIDDILSQN